MWVDVAGSVAVPGGHRDVPSTTKFRPCYPVGWHGFEIGAVWWAIWDVWRRLGPIMYIGLAVPHS